MLRIRCSRCNAKLKLKPELTGKEVECPKCGTRVYVTVADLSTSDSSPSDPHLARPALSHPELTALTPVPPHGAAPARRGSLMFWVISTFLILGTSAGIAGFLVHTGHIALPEVLPGARPAEPRMVAHNDQSPKRDDAGETSDPSEQEDSRSSTETDARPEVKETGPDEPAEARPEQAESSAKPGKRGDGESRPAAPRANGVGRRHVVLVGVKKYGTKGLNDLRFTEADVEELGQVLLNSGYEKDDVVMLTSRLGEGNDALAPTAANIRATLDRLLADCRAEDMVMLAFAGHGIELTSTKQFYFCPQGADLSSPDSLVSLNEVYDRLKNCTAGYKLLLADCCRNDPGSRGAVELPAAGVKSRPLAVPPPGGVMAFYSCSPTQFAYEPDELRHGLFFYYVLEGLKGIADLDSDGEIIREELEAFVKKRVRTYAVEKLQREQWPHLLGESNDQRVLVKLPAGRRKPRPADRTQPGNPSSPPSQTTTGPSASVATVEYSDSRVLLSEDFSTTLDGNLPAGWNGRGCYGVLKEDGRPVLQTTVKEGFPPISLPPLPLEGDFYVECEVYLPSYHACLIRLDGLHGGVPVWVSQGQVTLDRFPKRTGDRWVNNGLNRVRIVREANRYRVSINDSVVSAGPLPLTGKFDTVQFHLEPEAGHIQSVTVGQLAEPLKPANETGTVLLDEDFTQVQDGVLPEGWTGRFGVLNDGGGIKALQCTAKRGLQNLVLPPLALGNKFAIECELHLNSYHHLVARLCGLGSGPGVSIDISSGEVTLADVPKKQGTLWNRNVPNRVRIERDQTRVVVSLNDEIVAATQVEAGRSYDTIMLGVTGESLSSFYRVRAITYTLGAVAPTGPQARHPGIRSDFDDITPGSLPEGWVAMQPNISVQKNDNQAALEITNTNLGHGLVTLPSLKLPGDFRVEMEFELQSNDSSVALQFGGAASRDEQPVGDKKSNKSVPKPVVQSLTFGVDEDDQVLLQNSIVKFEDIPQWNNNRRRVVLERIGNQYEICLNDKIVMGKTLSPANAAGLFENIALGLRINSPKSRTPKLYSISITPRQEAMPVATIKGADE